MAAAAPITGLLLARRLREQAPLAELLPAVYSKIHNLAHCRVRRWGIERPFLWGLPAEPRPPRFLRMASGFLLSTPMCTSNQVVGIMRLAGTDFRPLSIPPVWSDVVLVRNLP